MITGMTEEPEVGRIYEGVVKSTTAFGAFVEILPGTATSRSWRRAVSPTPRMWSSVETWCG